MHGVDEPFLRYSIMQLLVSTPLHILLVNPFENQSKILRTGDGYYYGITFKDGVIALTHSGGYLQYFRKYQKPLETINHLIQPHQVEWIEDKILVSNTGKNCISVFDEDGHLLRDVYLNEIKWDDKDAGRKGNHFNSVHKIENRIVIVAHNYERPSEVWELRWPDLEVIGRKACKAAWAHNYWEGEWGQVICNSKQGSLYEVTTGEIIWRSGESNAMARGLAASKDYILVGYSSLNERKQRYWKTGGIWIIDRKTLQTVTKLLLPGAGDVHEIRLIGVQDDCHNGQNIELDDLKSLNRSSPIIDFAYKLGRSYPYFRQDLFPISQLVRVTQMTARWKKSIRMRSNIA